MTEQIKNTIKTFNQLLMLGQVDLPREEIESNIRTAIRSLNAWEEVLQELEEMKCEYDCTTNEFQRGANVGANFIRNKAIDIINQKLAEVQKGRQQ